MGEVLLGIDVGTTGTKGIIVDPKGHVLAEETLPATLSSRRPGWAEADPEQWWANAAALCRRMVAEGRTHPDSIAGVGVSGMVPAIVLVDATGRVLRPSIQQNDARCHEEIDHFRAATDGADILKRTGNPITQQSVGPKLLWLAQHEPDVMAEAKLVMGSYDFINYRLTGTPSVESNWALESGLYDLEKEDWDEGLLALARIKRSQLGPVYPPSRVIGSVSRWASQSTGLKPGTPVVAGSADHVASAFSAGLREKGDLLVKLGGAGDILYVLDELQPDPRLFIDYHVIPDKYLLNGCMAASGSIVKWFSKEVAVDAAYADLDAAAAELEPGAAGLILLPYFVGEKTPIHDPLARGILFGLTLHHSRAHIHRAILEGISFGFLHHVKVLEEIGCSIQRTFVTNGGSRSSLWRQITADVLGQSLQLIAHHPGSSLGAAFVAGMGVGVFEAWSEIGAYSEVTGLTEPDMQRHAVYQELYPIYRQLYETTVDLFPRLSEVAAH